jgi:DNA polymerase III subunit epsilon
MLEKLSLRLRILLFFAALACGALAALTAGLIVGYRHLAQPEALSAFVQVGTLAGFAILGLVTGVWYLFDLHVAKPIELLAGGLRARAHTEVGTSIDASVAKYLGDLAPAAASATDNLTQTRTALEDAVQRETARLSSENQRLEALLADVPVGVVLCSSEHQLAFYNGLGVDLLHAGGAVGLDRGLFDYLHEGPVRLAYARLIATNDPEAASDLLCTTRDAARVLAARMRLLVQADGVPSGYVLTLRDVTAELNTFARRGAFLAEVFDRLGRPCANIATLVEAMPKTVLAPALDQALRQEVSGLSQSYTALAQRHDQNRNEGWPLVLTRASDLLDGLAARLQSEGLHLSHDAAPLLLRCNGVEVIGLLTHLAAKLPSKSFHIDLTEDGADALIRLRWSGDVLSISDLDQWLAQPIDPALPEVTGTSVLSSHATDIWPETTSEGQSLCLPLRAARREGARPKPMAREVVYDFDLLSKSRNASVANALLQDLTYVVFDSETTGLLPEKGDEVVQIAAVRIVNGRRLKSEVFDMLVNPRRNIPAVATGVHGITNAMVADAPEIEEAARRFHAFAQGAVLIAHNAPFDMQFLRRVETKIGLKFDHPVLDTVLLSAVLYGQHEVHTLDALTHRLGITIPEEARHTAIGDAVATADAFLKLLPMLQGRGLNRFEDVLIEVRRHGRLLKDLN